MHEHIRHPLLAIRARRMIQGRTTAQVKGPTRHQAMDVVPLPIAQLHPPQPVCIRQSPSPRSRAAQVSCPG